MRIPNYCHRSQKIKLTKKQVEFKNSIGLRENGFANNGNYEHVLTEEDALKGANFFCFNNKQDWENLKSWANEDASKNVKFDSQGLRILSRSEHIPYNMFYPLALIQIQNNKDEELCSFFASICQNEIKVEEVIQIKIEYAPNNKLLDDNTSFDTYVELRTSIGIVALGIELKYTEDSYPYGETEKKRMDSKDSLYHKFSEGMYVNNAIEKLNSKKLKQPWRNHLLGIALCKTDSRINKFYSIHIYPEANMYQKTVCDEYTELLIDKSSFKSITFEIFTSKATSIFGKQDWIEYLKQRY